MNAIPLINNIPKTNINVGSIGGNETQLRQEINTSLVALKKEAGTLEGLINEAAQMLVTINNRIATLENDTVKKSDIVDVVQSGNMNPVTSNAVAESVQLKQFETLTSNDANKVGEGIYNCYRLNGDCANIPVNDIGLLMSYKYIRDQYQRITQEFITNNATLNTSAKYIRFGFSNDYGVTSTWSDWKKIAVDKDFNFSTDEVNTGIKWIDGKTIYKKVVNIGTLPNNGQKGVNHNISNLANIIKIYGFTNDGTRTFPLPFVGSSAPYSIMLYSTTTQVIVQTFTDRTAYTTSYAILEYTKS